jgi:hypothetical protein
MTGNEEQRNGEWLARKVAGMGAGQQASDQPRKLFSPRPYIVSLETDRRMELWNGVGAGLTESTQEER